MFMEFPVSGLQRLFRTAPTVCPQSSRTQSSLESVTEDAHTYDLLYPELSALRQTQNHAYPLKNGDPSSAALAATSYDDRGGLNIQSPRDIRILIAQDGNIVAQQPKVLYDSSPPIIFEFRKDGSTDAGLNGISAGNLEGFGLKRHNTAGHESQTANSTWHTRGSSFGFSSRPPINSPTSPSSPEAEFRGAFSNPRLRRSGTRPASSGGESIQNKIAREQREETEALLGCMFGSTGLPLASSTKIHIKPAEPTDTSSNLANIPIMPESGSNRPLPKRRTPLTRSMTVEDLHGLPSSLPESIDQAIYRSSNGSIIITRLFSIDLADSISCPKSDSEFQTSKVNVIDQPKTLGSSKAQLNSAENEKTKQVKTPTYAVAIVLQLPSDRNRSFTPVINGKPSVTPYSNHLSHSPKEMSSWSWQETLRSSDPGTSSEREIEMVLDYWNILNRVIFSLESVVSGVIKDLLIDVEANTARPLPQKQISEVEKIPFTKTKRLKQPSQRTVQLPSGALQHSNLIRMETDSAGKRIALALRTRKVIPGQGRWGIWREEARWVAKWAGNKEQNFFLFNILTAFLGTHTEWLWLLGSSWFRRRHSKQIQQHRVEVGLIRHRTIIVSANKMAARRLIFLLSAFLPSTHTGNTHEEAIHPHSPWSSAGYSQSPPSGISDLRQQSLRQTINRRQRGHRSGPNTKSHERGVSFSDQDFATNPSIIGGNNRNIQAHSRRASDAKSIQSLSLPMSSSNTSMRKSSSTTTGTIVADNAVPIPHFSNNLSPDLLLGTSAEARPGSSGSFASLSLKHTLTRSEGTDRSNSSSDSQSLSRWGSMLSGFWSPRRGSSSDGGDTLQSSQEGLGISGISRNARSIGKLAQMVEEAERPYQIENGKIFQESGPTSIPPLLETLNQLPNQSTPARNIPERPNIEHFPMKLSIDENEGVVDVDLPMPNSFSSSFTSSMSSLKASQTCTSSLNESSIYGRTSSHDSSSPGAVPTVHVTGWLKRYHPDYVLQAVRPYKELEEDIQRSMRMERMQLEAAKTPRLSGDDSASGGWTEICTAIIADAQNFSVRRLSLRQRENPVSVFSKSSTPPMEEEFVSEPIMDLDATLIDAVERVLAQSSQSSRTHSRTHSRTASPSHHDGPYRPPEMPFLEVPKSECRKVVLGALEQVAKKVRDEQDRKGRGFHKEREETVGMDSLLREGLRNWFAETAG